jgi:hypothetical protein
LSHEGRRKELVGRRRQQPLRGCLRGVLPKNELGVLRKTVADLNHMAFEQFRKGHFFVTSFLKLRDSEHAITTMDVDAIV